MRRLLLVVAVPALLLAACAPAAAPAIDPAQVQASAAAAAAIMIAKTKAAMPTITPVPPTPLPSDTPLPSSTPLALPTLQGLATSTASSGSGTSTGDCNQLLDVGASGPQAPLMIRNDTKGPVTFSMGLGAKNSFGQCGYMGWAVPKLGSITVSVPITYTNQGDPCYWAFAFINDPKRQTNVSGGGYCINNNDKWTFDVSYDRIKLTPP